MARGIPRLTTRLISRAAACDALGVAPRSFSRHWAAVFTDPRPPDDRRPRVRRQVYEDEVAVAVEAGGGRRGRLAVLDYRARVGRSKT